MEEITGFLAGIRFRESLTVIGKLHALPIIRGEETAAALVFAEGDNLCLYNHGIEFLDREVMTALPFAKVFGGVLEESYVNEILASLYGMELDGIRPKEGSIRGAERKRQKPCPAQVAIDMEGKVCRPTAMLERHADRMKTEGIRSVWILFQENHPVSDRTRKSWIAFSVFVISPLGNTESL